MSNYTPLDSQDLQFFKGDLVYILEKDESGWWKGFSNGRIGLFPCNFVETENGVDKLSMDIEPSKSPSHSKYTLRDLSFIANAEPGAAVPNDIDVNYLEVKKISVNT